MVLTNFGCLLIESSRSKAYIQKLIGNSLLPSTVIFLELEKKKKAASEATDPVEKLISNAFGERKYFIYDSALKGSSLPSSPSLPSQRKYASFDPDEPVRETLRKHDIEFTTIRASEINATAVTTALASSTPEYFLFGGGGILKKPAFDTGKKFIHLHPGRIPFFRGSHCIEWSVLLEGRCAVTAFIMNEVIDGGDLIAQRDFDPPEGVEGGNVPSLYSAHIRSELLVDVVKGYARTGRFETTGQDTSEGETYYKMHPALAALVLHKIETAVPGGR